MSALSLPTRSLAPYAPTLLRVTVGVIMAAHGWQKLTGMTPAGFGEGMLAGLGVPAPLVFGWIVTLIELVGGLALIVGLGSRIAAGLTAIVIAGATVLVKLDIGLIAEMGSPLPGAELDLLLIAGSLAVVLLGPGRLALDAVLGLDTAEVTLESDVTVTIPEARTRARV